MIQLNFDVVNKEIEKVKIAIESGDNASMIEGINQFKQMKREARQHNVVVRKMAESLIRKQVMPEILKAFKVPEFNLDDIKDIDIDLSSKLHNIDLSGDIDVKYMENNCVIYVEGSKIKGIYLDPKDTHKIIIGSPKNKETIKIITGYLQQNGIASDVFGV